MSQAEKYSERYFPERFRTAFPAESYKAAQLFQSAPIPMPTPDILQAMQHHMVEAYTKDISRLPSEQRPSRPSPTIAQAMSLAFVYGKFYVAGRQIYDVGHKMQSVLAGADYRDVPVSMLTLPFPSLYLHFGPQAFTIKGAAFEGAYVAAYKGQVEIHLCTTQRQIRTGSDRFIHPSHYLYLSFDATKYPPDTSLGDVIDDAVHEEIQQLEQRSARPTEQIEVDGVVVTDRAGEGAQEDMENYLIAIQNLHDAMRLVVNSIIFVTAYREHVHAAWTTGTPDELVAAAESTIKPKARQVARQQLLKEGYYKVNFVGSHFAYEACDEESHGESDGVRPHWRRAHWRLQRYGEGRQEQRMVLIRQVLVNADKLESGQLPPGRISTI